MATSSYLDTFLSTVEDAPQELRRNLQHMRSLDTEAQDLVERIKKLAKNHVTRAKRSVSEGSEPSEELLHKVRGLQRKVEEIGNEKVNLAAHLEEQIQRHLRRLNEDLSRFEVELNERGKLKGQQPNAVPGADSGAGSEGPDEAGPSRKRAKNKRPRNSAVPAAPVPPAPSSKAPRASSAPPSKRKSESLDLDLDLDLGPELAEAALPAAVPALDKLYPNLRLPIASKDEQNKSLCGAIPLDSGVINAGQKVAARTSPAKVEPQEWILCTVQKAVGSKYLVSDDDDHTGQNTYTLATSALIALPLTEPATFTRAHEHKEGTAVLAMFPDTTCFYKATVAVAPSKRRERDYLIEFEDDQDADGRTAWRQVPVKYVVPQR